MRKPEFIGLASRSILAASLLFHPSLQGNSRIIDLGLYIDQKAPHEDISLCQTVDIGVEVADGIWKNPVQEVRADILIDGTPERNDWLFMDGPGGPGGGSEFTAVGLTPGKHEMEVRVRAIAEFEFVGREFSFPISGDREIIEFNCR